MNKVKHLTIKVVSETIHSVQGSYPDKSPYIRYRSFGPSTIDLTIIGFPKALGDRALITHTLIKNIYAAYADEGIDLRIQ